MYATAFTMHLRGSNKSKAIFNAPAGMTIHNKFHVTNANKNCGDGSPSFVLSESKVLIRMTRL